MSTEMNPLAAVLKADRHHSLALGIAKAIGVTITPEMTDEQVDAAFGARSAAVPVADDDDDGDFSVEYTVSVGYTALRKMRGRGASSRRMTVPREVLAEGLDAVREFVRDSSSGTDEYEWDRDDDEQDEGELDGSFETGGEEFDGIDNTPELRAAIAAAQTHVEPEGGEA